MSRQFKLYKGSDFIKQGESPLQVTGLETGTIYPEGYFQLSAYDTVYENESAKVDVPEFTTTFVNKILPITASKFTGKTAGTTVVDDSEGIKIVSDGTSRIQAYTTVTQPVTDTMVLEGKTYTFSVKIKLNRLTIGSISNVRVSLVAQPGGSQILQTPAFTPLMHQWVTVKSTAQMTSAVSNQTHLRLVIQEGVVSGVVADTEFQLKDFQLVEGAQPLPKQAT